MTVGTTTIATYLGSKYSPAHAATVITSTMATSGPVAVRLFDDRGGQEHG
jgi:hypothetical protein